MEEICYNKNFITEAISKVDFLNPIENLDTALPKEFSNTIKDNFPIAESRQVKNKIVNIVDDEVRQELKEYTEWHFWNKERNRRITLSKNVLMLVQNRYSTFQSFSDEFSCALRSICDINKDVIIKRFGVRYINNISLNEPKPLEWSNYINERMIATIDIPKHKDKISRTFHTLEMNYDDFNFRFNFGIHNPDYPALIKRKVFILDMDAYHTGMLNKSDVESALPIYHSKIQDFFENSITEEFRKKYLNDGE